MKKRIYTTSIVLMLLTLIASCDVLNQEPESLIPTTSAITDARSAESALNGLYNSIQDGDLYGGRFIMANEMLANNATAAAFQAFWSELASGNVPASNFHLEDLWVSAYAAINSANAIIVQVPKISDIEEDDADRIMGTAYFFRAMMHFDLLRQFGEFFDSNSAFGIPLALEQSLEIKEIPRASVSDTYAQINKDLQKAIKLLPNQGNKFYTSSSAARALRARVALYQRDYEKAITMANNVISNGAYTLPTDYNGVYTSEGSGESIFELNFIELVDANAWAIEMYTSPPEVAVDDDLVTFLNDQGETERAVYFEEVNGLTRCTKYGDNPNANGGNTILFRLSEMYLIRAEALAMQNGGSPNDALTDLNAVSTRAEQGGYVGFANESELITALLNERRAEFAFEGHYWFDLVRLGRMESELGRPSFRKVLPIPLRELSITDGTLVQNPGY